MERKRYGSDISRQQFEQVRPMLESAKQKTRPRKHDLYDIFCAILYVMKSACTWRNLPGDFAPWRTVHEYFRQWSARRTKSGTSLLEDALKKCGEQRAYAQWSVRQNDVLYHRRAKRQEHRYGTEERV